MSENEKNNDIINVNCSFCGKEIECPKNMLDKVEKHACFECYKNLPPSKSKVKVHVDIPQRDLSDNVAKEEVEKMLRDVFPKIWAEHKEELKKMSKQKLAQEMFAQGAFIALSNAIDTFSEEEDEDREGEK